MEMQYNWVKWPQTELVPLENFYVGKSKQWIWCLLVIVGLLALAYFAFNKHDQKDEAQY